MLFARLQRFLRGRRYRAARKEFDRNFPNLKPRQELAFLIEQISPSVFQNYNPAAAQGWFVNSDSPTLLQLAKRIRDLNHLLKLGRLLPRPNATSIKPRYVDRFIATNGGFYSSPETALTIFRKEVREFCELMEDTDLIDFGPEEHNLRMATDIINETTIVTTKLLEVYLAI